MANGLNRAAVNNSLMALKNYAVEDKGVKVFSLLLLLLLFFFWGGDGSGVYDSLFVCLFVCLFVVTKHVRTLISVSKKSVITEMKAPH